MTTDVVTLSPATTVKQAAAVLAGREVASAPVVDEAGAVVGIVSEIDLLAHDVPPDPLARLSFAPADSGPSPRTVADVMTSRVVTLPPDADAAEFLRRMLADRIVCIPVTDDGTLVGVVSRRDLLRLLARPDAEIAADVLAAVEAALPGQDWEVEVAEGLARLTGGAPDADAEVAARVAQGVPGVVRVSLGT
jgi:CBS domain-containing protein